MSGGACREFAAPGLFHGPRHGCHRGGVLSQRTIAEKITCTGIGLHSGAPVQLTLHPERADVGVVFVRTDLAHPVEIPARHDAVTSTVMATTLGRGDATLSTVEHLMSAIVALGVDNLRVEVDGPEIPVMDGSAEPFVYLIRTAGLYDQRAERRVLRIRETLEVRDGERSIRIQPFDGLRVTYGVDFDHPAIGRQRIDNLTLDDDTFEREIARARTFGFLRDVEALWRAGLARGGNLENTVVMDDQTVLNREGLRYRDEFVRHKILDLVGDLSLIGMPISGHVIADRGGHALHQALVRAILDTPSAWVVEGLLEPVPDDSSEIAPLAAVANA
jgi:UDP-3-O-[3-hydroxymyristoyl] N-acetylglucosamine deacetylase